MCYYLYSFFWAQRTSLSQCYNCVPKYMFGYLLDPLLVRSSALTCFILQQKETKRLKACVVDTKVWYHRCKAPPNAKKDKIMCNRKVCMRSEGRKSKVLTGYRDSLDGCSARSGAL